MGDHSIWAIATAATLSLGTLLAAIAKWKQLGELVLALARFFKVFIFGNQQVLNELVKIREEMAKQASQIRGLVDETRFNGGHTLKDDVRDLHAMGLTIKAQVKELINSGNLAVFMCDQNGECTWASDSLLELYRLRSEEMMGTLWLRAVDPRDRRRVHEEWRRSVEEGYPFDYNYRLEGGVRVHATAEALVDKSGKVCGFHGAVRPER